MLNGTGQRKAGKRFAVVLTHDVEGSKGLSRVEQLMGLEAKHGFRSSFNFVPEGEYRLPDTLRQKMRDAGFEVLAALELFDGGE